jgi:hypothetical protein
VAGRRGHEWIGSESPWFDALLVGILVVDIVLEATLAIVDRIRRGARNISRDGPVHPPNSHRRESA